MLFSPILLQNTHVEATLNHPCPAQVEAEVARRRGRALEDDELALPGAADAVARGVEGLLRRPREARVVGAREGGLVVPEDVGDAALDRPHDVAAHAGRADEAEAAGELRLAVVGHGGDARGAFNPAGL